MLPAGEVSEKDCCKFRQQIAAASSGRALLDATGAAVYSRLTFWKQ